VVKEFRHTISSPEGAIGVVAVAVNSGGSSITDRYFLKDHLGSNAGTFIGNSAANSLESRATYDVWGNRISSATPALSGFDTSQRGYTGHEHLATYGLIHMNGRIYDPVLGRFLQADPIIQSPYDLQSYNRYAYVMNNPLAYTDPTGYSRWTNFRDRYGKTILAIGVSVVLGPGGYYGAWVGGSKVATAAAAGFAAGGIMGGNLNSALAGAVSGALFGAAGAMTTPTSFASYAAHAAAGCASAAASGGSCGSGAAGAVVGKLFTNLTVASLGQSSPGAHFAGAVIGGGMGSLAAGGRFQDGAFSAGLGYVLNCLASRCLQQTWNQNAPGYHRYSVDSPILCNTGETGCLAAVEKQQLCNSAPGQGTCAIVGKDVDLTLTGNNRITQYAMTRDIVINGTSLGHLFDDGYVLRTRMINENGDVFIRTIGEGVNFNYGVATAREMGWLNQRLGAKMFERIGIENHLNVRESLHRAAANK
ncbi:MAG: RHS repeat-associated core domain-containing protein, partial [Betaproteobacteria bacterium]